MLHTNFSLYRGVYLTTPCHDQPSRTVVSVDEGTHNIPIDLESDDARVGRTASRNNGNTDNDNDDDNDHDDIQSIDPLDCEDIRARHAAAYTGCSASTRCLPFCCCCRVISHPTDACVCTFDPYQRQKRFLFPNGAWPVILAQLCMALGTCLSAQTITDCHLVRVNATQVDPILSTIMGDSSHLVAFDNHEWNDPVATTAATGTIHREYTGLGLFSFQAMDGSCVHFQSKPASPQHSASHDTTMNGTPVNENYSFEEDGAGDVYDSYEPEDHPSDQANQQYRPMPDGDSSTELSQYDDSGGEIPFVIVVVDAMEGDSYSSESSGSSEESSITGIGPAFRHVAPAYFLLFLGPEWITPQVMASVAANIAILSFFWLATYTCWSHTYRLRQCWSVLVVGVICPLQCATLIVALGSGPCDAYTCKWGRTTWAVFGSIPCFLLAALILSTQTRNYYPDMERFERPRNFDASKNYSSRERSLFHRSVATILLRGRGPTTVNMTDRVVRVEQDETIGQQQQQQQQQHFYSGNRQHTLQSQIIVDNDNKTNYHRRSNQSNSDRIDVGVSSMGGAPIARRFHHSFEVSSPPVNGNRPQQEQQHMQSLHDSSDYEMVVHEVPISPALIHEVLMLQQQEN